MEELLELVNKSNVYIAQSRSNVNVSVLEKIATYISNMVRVFGLCQDLEFGFGHSLHSKGDNAVMPLLHTLSTFRDSVRDLARNKQDHSKILQLCDQLRDVDLPQLGVLLDDRDDGKALVKLVGQAEIQRIKEEKKKREEEKAAKKAAQQAELEKKKLERLEKGRIAPEEMFKAGEHSGQFSQYDEQGIPTHDVNGQELAKSRRKKLQKDWEIQKKLHAEFLAAQ